MGTEPNGNLCYCLQTKFGARQCFYTCLCLPHCMMGYTPPARHPLGRHPTWADTPPRQTPPRQTPPRQTPPPYTDIPGYYGIRSTSGRYASYRSAYLLASVCVQCEHYHRILGNTFFIGICIGFGKCKHTIGRFIKNAEKVRKIWQTFP